MMSSCVKAGGKRGETVIRQNGEAGRGEAHQRETCADETESRRACAWEEGRNAHNRKEEDDRQIHAQRGDEEDGRKAGGKKPAGQAQDRSAQGCVAIEAGQQARSKTLQAERGSHCRPRRDGGGGLRSRGPAALDL